MNDSQAGPSRDPYQLDRLAEELATRERSFTQTDDEDDDEQHDLPVHVPLAHDNPFLTADAFDIEQFLLSRSHVSLPDLRTELRDYLSTLKEELVSLINNDYEAFISLSTDLRGEGARLNKLKAPLDGLRTQVQASKSELQVTQEAIQQKLETRAVLREEKALLHLLLKISESVTRLEGLLLISAPSNDDETPIDAAPSLVLPTIDGTEDKSRANQAKHLSRVAAEYTQLLYHASKARDDNCVFVDEIQWRIDRIQSTLSSDLDHHFSSLLQALTDGKGQTKLTEVDKAKLSADLRECLRTYDMLGLWRDAEDIIRRNIIRRFVKKTIFSGALNAPQSPLVPHTPFNPGFAAQPPKTPYTPFTAFPTKSFPQSATTKNQNPYMVLLEESDEPLANLYCQILRFVERDLCHIMNMAEKVSIKSLPAGRLTPLTSTFVTGDTDKGFHIMANVVWDEFGRAIMDELGSVVFSVGRPGVFRKNYEITQVFIRSLEWMSPSEQAVESMRMHNIYTSFERRWQLPVYFQMRWKEIVTKLEEALVSLTIDPSSKAGDVRFLSLQAAATWTALSTGWTPEVYIRELSHRFWRLTLQLISRYKTWLDDSILNLDRKASALPSAALRSSTPVPEPSDTTHSDDNQLTHCATLVIDIGTMKTTVLELWREQISRMLPAAEDEEDDGVDNEVVLQHSLSELFALIPSIETRIVSILSKRCTDALHNIRGIPTQFRSDRNKRPLTGPSKFVPDILQPIKTFFSSNSTGAALPADLRESMTKKVIERVLQRYLVYIVELKKIEDPLRRLKKNKKPAFSLFGSATAGKDDEDDERIKTQMILDVDAFGKDAQSLDIAIEGDETFKALHDLVQAFDQMDNSGNVSM